MNSLSLISTCKRKYRDWYLIYSSSLIREALPLTEQPVANMAALLITILTVEVAKAVANCIGTVTINNLVSNQTHQAKSICANLQ